MSMNVRRQRVQRLFWLFGASTIIGLAAIALIAVRAIAVGHQNAVEVAQTELQALADASELQGLLYQKGFATQYFLTGDPRWLDELHRATPAFEQWLAGITRDAQSPESSQAVSALVTEYGRYDADRDRAIAQFQSGDRDGATRTIVAAAARAAQLRDLANRLIKVRRNEVSAKIEAADRSWRRSLWLLAAAVVAAILAAAAIGYFLARRITRPLYELVLRAESAAGGARVEVDADDEIGALSEHVTRLARQIESSSAALAEQRARLTQAEKMSALGEMATAVAHEVLNPLTGVKTAMQLLAKTNASPDVVETTSSVDEEIRRIEGMARRLVSFARPLQPELRDCDLDEVLQRVCKATRAEAESRKVRIDTVRADGKIFPADPDLLAQVLINLTSNACQAVAPGGAVKISSHRDGNWRVIEVADDGPGISPEIADRLFTPFATTKRDGHGLGLAVSQNIALAHGGRIQVRSNSPLRGSTFSLWLPEAT
jgi:signal transduction histidine kinase